MIGEPLTLSVEQLNEYVRRSLASDPILHGVRIRGEISNFKRHISGHWYFTLKDETSAINCAMFRQSTFGVGFIPKDGQRVVLLGNVGLYTKTGQYQFYVDALEQDGVGELYLRFEALKQKLSEEGLFDAAAKKRLPLLPRAIGVVTSKTGAVIHDIQQVAWRRNPAMPIYLCAASVQGSRAASEIVAAIEALDRRPDIDVMIVGRGGGSMEDLWPFNEEKVARAIFACSTPIVSAVGHETDVTIADFVADVRAATPSAAAELVVEERTTLLGMVEKEQRRMVSAACMQCQQKYGVVQELRRRMAECNPVRRIETAQTKLTTLQEKLRLVMQTRLQEKLHALEQLQWRISAASPQTILARGYAIATDENGVLTSADKLAIGADVTIRLQSGAFDASVTRIVKEEQNAQERTDL